MLGERPRVRQHQREVRRQRLAVGAAAPRPALQEGLGARGARGAVEQVGGHHRREEEIVVDHRVVVERLAQILGPQIAREVAARRPLADVLFVGHRAVVAEAIDDRAEPRLDDAGLERGQEEHEREERVAAEIREEPPRSREQLLLVREERQRGEGARAGAAAVGQEILGEDRRQRLVVGERGHGEADLAAFSRGDHDPPRRLDRRGGAGLGRDPELDVVATVEGGAAEDERRPRLDRAHEIRGHLAAEGELAQAAHAPEHHAAHAERGRARGDHRGDAAHSIVALDGREPPLDLELHALVVRLEPPPAPTLPAGNATRIRACRPEVESRCAATGPRRRKWWWVEPSWRSKSSVSASSLLERKASLGTRRRVAAPGALATRDARALCPGSPPRANCRERATGLDRLCGACQPRATRCAATACPTSSAPWGVKWRKS